MAAKAPTNTNGSLDRTQVEKSTESRISALEHKYIELLEQKVAELEASLAKATAAKPNDEGQDKESISDSNSNVGRKNSVATKSEHGKSKEEKEAMDVVSEDSAEESRYRIVLNSLDSLSGEFVDKTPTVASKAPKKPNHGPQRAFTFRKFMRPRMIGDEEAARTRGSEVEIESEILQKLLAKVIRKYTSDARITEMESPYASLVWSWGRAEKAANAAPANETDVEKQARKDLKALMEIISTSSGDERLDRYFKLRETSSDNRTILFESLWTLFPKGSYIINRPFLNHEQVFFIQSCRIPTIDEPATPFTVVAYSYDWDGYSFNRVPYQLSITEFSDKKSIFELPFYPLEDYRGSGGDESSGKDAIQRLRTELIERGKTFYKYCVLGKGQQTFRYTGPAYRQYGRGIFSSESDDDAESHSGASSDRIEEAYFSGNSASHLQGTVVVDFKSYFQFQPLSAPLLGDLKRYEGRLECSCSECRESYGDMFKYSWDNRKPARSHGKQFDSEQYMMFPPRVLGYSLAAKQWVQLDVTKLRKAGEADERNFNEKLIMDEDKKSLIRQAVQAHGEANVVDYVTGKGKSLVVLLWGVPGVGKTLTAESVAALAGKPLFTIGVSDIGIQSDKVEVNLQRIFTLAGAWQAVLLFDEADVFLEARDARGSDMQRNSMVSVLLRILEYYDGILILTTNRLKTFDIAVQSRIHIAVEYDDLSPKQRQLIYNDFLGQLRQQKLIENWDSCFSWVEEEGQNKPVNGRQIRNLVSTAMGLAHAEKRKLRRSDLSKVARNTNDFLQALSDQTAVFRNSQIRAKWN